MQTSCLLVCHVDHAQGLVAPTPTPTQPTPLCGPLGHFGSEPDSPGHKIASWALKMTFSALFHHPPTKCNAMCRFYPFLPIFLIPVAWTFGPQELKIAFLGLTMLFCASFHHPPSAIRRFYPFFGTIFWSPTMGVPVTKLPENRGHRP